MRFNRLPSLCAMVLAVLAFTAHVAVGIYANVSVASAQSSTSLSLTLTSLGVDEDRANSSWQATVVNTYSEQQELYLDASVNIGVDVVVTSITPSGSCSDSSGHNFSSGRLSCTIAPNSELQIEFSARTKNSCNSSVFATARLHADATTGQAINEARERVRLGARNCPSLQVDARYDRNSNEVVWRITIEESGVSDIVRINTEATRIVEPLPDGCERDGTSTPISLQCDLGVTNFDDEDEPAEIVVAATPPCGISTIQSRITARFQIDGALISNGTWSKEIRISSGGDECIAGVEIVPSTLTSAINGTTTISVIAVGANGNALDALPSSASVAWSAQRGVTVAHGDSATYTAPLEIGDGTDTISVKLSFGDTTLNDSATATVTAAVTGITVANVEMGASNEYRLRMIAGDSVAFGLNLTSSDGADVTELANNGDVELAWTVPTGAGSIDDSNLGQIRYTASGAPGAYEVALLVNQRSSGYSETLVFKIQVRDPPTQTGIEIVDAGFVADSRSGVWNVRLSNSDDEAATFTVRASVNIGVAPSETSGRCTTKNGSWSCSVPANDHLDLVFTAALGHMCPGSATLTVRAALSGTNPFDGSDSATVRGSTLNCPGITLTNARYDEQTQSASWLITVEKRSSGLIHIELGSHAEVSDLPVGCSFSTQTVECDVTVFSQESVSFTIAQHAIQFCEPHSVGATVAASFVSDGARIPVESPNLKVLIPKDRYCIYGAAIEPSSFTATIGEATQLRVIAFDESGNPFPVVPSNVVVEWGALNGTIIAAGHTALYIPLDERGEDAVTVTLTQHGRTFDASASARVVSPPSPSTSPRNFISSLTDNVDVAALNWDPPADDGGATIDGYRLTWSPDAPPTPIDLPADARTYEATGLRLGVEYTFSLLAYNGAGSGDAAIITFTIPIPTTAPSAPRNLAWGQSDVGKSVTLSWDPPADDGGATIDGYLLTWSPDAPPSPIELPPDARTYVPSGLNPGTEYTVSLTAYNVAGSSDAAIITFTVPIPTTAPSAPQNLNWDPSDAEESGTLSWDPPADDGGATIDGYRLTWSPDAPQTPTEVQADARAYVPSGLNPGTEYTVSLTAYNVAGSSDAAVITFTIRIPTTAPSAPQNLLWDQSDAGKSGTLSWDAPADDGGSQIGGYRLTWWPDSPTMPIDLPADTRTYEANGLRPEVEYTFSLLAYNVAGSSEAVIITFTTPVVPAAPPAPRNLAWGQSDVGKSVTLSWDPPVDDGGATIDGYRLTWSPDPPPSPIELPPDGRTYVPSGLNSGTEYTVSLTAYNAAGTSDAAIITFTTPVVPTAPSPPQNLTWKLSDTVTSALLSWDAPAHDGGSPIDGYRLTWSPDAPQTPIEVQAEARTYVPSGLNPGTEYRVSLTAYNGAGSSDAAIITFTTPMPTTAPSAPQNLAWGPSDAGKSVMLSWDPPADDGGATIDGYLLTWSPDAPPTPIEVQADARRYVPSGLNPGTEYTVSLVAFNDAGSSDAATITFTIPVPATTPSAPQTLTWEPSDTGTSASLSWDPPADDGGANIDGYRLTWSPDAPLSPIELSADARTYVPSGLNPGKEYTVSLTAYNAVGSSDAATIIFTTPVVPTAPPAPQNLTWKQSETGTSASLSWDAPAHDGGSPIDGYVLTWSPDAPPMPIEVPADALTYVASGLKPGTEYSVSLIAYNAAGSSDAATITFTTPVVPTAPSAPQNLTWMLSETGASASLSWDAPADDGGSPIDGYRLTLSPDAPPTLIELHADARTYAPSGLNPGTEYTVSLVAFNIAGSSDAATIIFTPLVVPTAPSAPQNLTWDPSDEEESGTLSWDPPAADGGATIDGYLLTWSPDAPPSPIELPAGISNYEVVGLRRGVNYVATLTAFNSAGEGNSATISFATPVDETSPPGAPRNLNWIADGPFSVIISWVPPTTHGGIAEGYRLTWSSDASSQTVELSQETRSHPLVNLRTEATYTVALSAVNSAGSSEPAFVSFELPLTSVQPPPSSPEPEGDPVPASRPPPAPRNLSLSAGEDEYTLTWDAPAPTPGASVESYILNWEPDPPPEPVVLPHTAFGYLLPDFTSGVEYTFSLVAFNSIGLSDPVINSLRIPAIDPPPPPVEPLPSNVQSSKPTPKRNSSRKVSSPSKPLDLAIVQMPGAVRLLWDEPESDGGSDIEVYTIEWSPDPPPFPLMIKGNDQWIDVLGLQGGEKYRIVVRAHNGRKPGRRARGHIELGHTLLQPRQSEDYVGTIVHGRSVSLQNTDQLPGIELISGDDSLFWGDVLELTVKPEPFDLIPTISTQSWTHAQVSDRYLLQSSIASRRSRFDASANSYLLPEPIRLCLTPNREIDAPDAFLSIAVLHKGAESELLDSETHSTEENVSVCTLINRLPLRESVTYALVAVSPFDPNHANADSSPVEGVTIAALFLGISLVAYGARTTSSALSPRSTDSSQQTQSQSTLGGGFKTGWIASNVPDRSEWLFTVCRTVGSQRNTSPAGRGNVSSSPYTADKSPSKQNIASS